MDNAPKTDTAASRMRRSSSFCNVLNTVTYSCARDRNCGCVKVLLGLAEDLDFDLDSSATELFVDGLRSSNAFKLCKARSRVGLEGLIACLSNADNSLGSATVLVILVVVVLFVALEVVAKAPKPSETIDGLKPCCINIFDAADELLDLVPFLDRCPFIVEFKNVCPEWKKQKVAKI